MIQRIIKQLYCHYQGLKCLALAENQEKDLKVYPKGKHNSNPSTAVDVYPYPISFDKVDLPRFYWFGGWVLAKALILLNVGEINHKIKWGGNWRGLNNGQIDFSYNMRKDVLDDLPHFELIPHE